MSLITKDIPWVHIYAARDALSAEVWRKTELLDKIEKGSKAYAIIDMMLDDQTMHLKALNKWLNSV